jgi:hypothetical protein
MQKFKHVLFLCFVLPLILVSCTKDKIEAINYQTEHVIIIVMDGARYSETWGDTTHQYIPKLANELAPTGIINTHFYNNGTTSTVPGHTAMTTGRYQGIDNGGAELPQYPSIFQYWNSSYNNNPSKAWVIASKGKLEVLSDCIHPEWNGKYNPLTNCGINAMGTGSGYREDSITYNRAKQLLSSHHPNICIINFREPDYSGHLNNWDSYLYGIQSTDQYIHLLIDFIEADPIYAGKTTVFVTNDHGRHLNTVSSGFSSHGDGCEGCRHILFYAYGPDFKKDEVISVQRELIDIPATIAELLHFDMPYGEGRVMYELFE